MAPKRAQEEHLTKEQQAAVDTHEALRCEAFEQGVRHFRKPYMQNGVTPVSSKQNICTHRWSATEGSIQPSNYRSQEVRRELQLAWDGAGTYLTRRTWCSTGEC
jgi:hypothetical protein